MTKKRSAWGELKALWATILFGWATRLDLSEVLYLADRVDRMIANEPGRVRYYKDAGGFVSATTNPKDIAAARNAEIEEGINCGR